MTYPDEMRGSIEKIHTWAELERVLGACKVATEAKSSGGRGRGDDVFGSSSTLFKSGVTTL